MQTTLFYILALAMGVMLSIYLPMNSTVARHLGSPITASMPFFFVAFLTTIGILLIFGDTGTLLKLKQLPPNLFLPGFAAAFMVLGTTFLIPKIGARKFFILTIAGQILMAMILSHFGALESPKDPVTLKKLAGAVLIVVGAGISTL
ncbi:MAG: DMT family transporter [Deltaproteobacteria bacterium]|nr:DMT family transporter [Deltaproteobacteria bacterium]